MTNSKSRPGPLSVKAALAIINSTVNPALRHEASNVTAHHLAEIIERGTNVTALLAALEHVYSLVDPGVSPDAPWAIEKSRTAIAEAKAA